VLNFCLDFKQFLNYTVTYVFVGCSEQERVVYETQRFIAFVIRFELLYGLEFTHNQFIFENIVANANPPLVAKLPRKNTFET
jgi:uncharacterized membrane protein